MKEFLAYTFIVGFACGFTAALVLAIVSIRNEEETK